MIFRLSFFVALFTLVSVCVCPENCPETVNETTNPVENDPVPVEDEKAKSIEDEKKKSVENEDKISDKGEDYMYEYDSEYDSDEFKMSEFGDRYGYGDEMFMPRRVSRKEFEKRQKEWEKQRKREIAEAERQRELRKKRDEFIKSKLYNLFLFLYIHSGPYLCFISIGAKFLRERLPYTMIPFK